ncbi:hypothetical protein BP6252_01837 [Coleophoma cylindrospora]|uniref:FAD-binding domain-containing protein n=1 Tax=Coleophoma cylindrospora TaxID=1849047 RepID=A0A3D8SD33_9HELO|nr:hypothetical protein BP6252_01837 [Coleophoma cylindrospora]
MADMRIIIVGGGIAGLAVALRGSSRDIVVLEASQMNKEVGALISLQPNASKIATKLGLDKYLGGKGPTRDKAFRIYNTDGELQAEIPSTERFGADRLVYHRADLHDALKQAATAIDGLGRPVRIIPSSRVMSCDSESGLVMLENGEHYSGDVIVGADGIHSTMRTIITGPDVSSPKPTGISAYRLLLDMKDVEKSRAFTSIINPREPFTTMVVGYDKRVIMGPGNNASLYGIVALIPDEHMHEASRSDSWTSNGSMKKLLESFAAFPEWILEVFKASGSSPALYQLRDIDPLESWVHGRMILIGDAAHAMLPTQGQGASQSFEDAEALREFLNDIPTPHTQAQIRKSLHDVFEARHERASLIQAYSRQQARPGTDMNRKRVTLNPAEFQEYNCAYEGARVWQAQQSSLKPIHTT